MSTEAQVIPAEERAKELLAKVRDRTARVGVIGLGYVGWPLAEAFVTAGFKVLGFDTDKAKVETLKAGKSVWSHIPNKRVEALWNTVRFRIGSAIRDYARCDVVIVCVPTPLTSDGRPDMGAVYRAGMAIAEHRNGVPLVVLESTVYPGATETVLAEAMHECGNAELEAGRDYFLAYSPEREDPGSGRDMRLVPKLIAGHDRISLELATAVYGTVYKHLVPCSSIRVAETAKLLENAYRAVNLALVNELKQTCNVMGVDVREVIAAAATKPFGFQAFYPGPGCGGPCIAKDSQVLAWKARQVSQPLALVETAVRVNELLPQGVVWQIVQALNVAGKPVKGSRVLLLGVSYKRGVGDLRNTPAVPILRWLRELGAAVHYHDPHVPEWTVDEQPVPHYGLDMLLTVDLCVVLTDHAEIDWQQVRQKAVLLVDTRGVPR